MGYLYMEWKRLTTVKDFWLMSQSFLYRFESRYVKHVSFFEIPKNQERDDIFLWSLLDNNTCCAFAVLTQAGHLYCSEIPDPANRKDILDLDILDDLISLVLSCERDVFEIEMPNSLISYVTEQFFPHFESDMNKYVFECSSVLLPPAENGTLVQATNSEEHQNIVISMLKGFLMDCFPNIADPNQHIEKARKRIDSGDIYLWKNGEGDLVSMAARVRKTSSTSSISWVYTANVYRGRGYGSKVTAYLTQLLLEQGSTFCNLYTDASNPTSNSIYQKIGYCIIGEETSCIKKSSIV